MKLIHAYVCNPRKSLMKMAFGSSNTSKATCYTASCSSCNNCELYKMGQCLLLSNVSCPYGQSSTESGFTSKSKGFYTWIIKKETEYKDVLNALTKADDKLDMIGDYVYFPYSTKLNLKWLGLVILCLSNPGSSVCLNSHLIT